MHDGRLVIDGPRLDRSASMKILVAAATVIALSGCVVAPYPGAYGPGYEQAYTWDPGASLYFYMGPDRRRHYMPHGWRHGHGYRR
jgi:hypothetical protein